MEKRYIVITGRRNNGKSSLINALTGQETAIVSDIPGTTTDPVKKSYEIPEMASVVFVDTAGIDDDGELGEKRVLKTEKALSQADLAILVITGNRFETPEKRLVEMFQSLKLPFLIIHNKSDLTPLNQGLKEVLERTYDVPVLDFIASGSSDTTLLMEAIREVLPSATSRSLIGDLIQKGDLVMLVTPIDAEAPHGRLILPQVQMIRDILDNACICILLQPDEMMPFLDKTGITPRLVITDSQAFKDVAPLLPDGVPLTSFSIILARHRGNFDVCLKGTTHIDKLKDGDRVLMLESCSHHVSCEDIGRIKIPALLRKYTGKSLEFDFVAGLDPIRQPLSGYALAIQCGGCMVTSRQLQNRLQPIVDAGIPVSNYGMAIAWLQGIFQRTIAPFDMLSR